MRVPFGHGSPAGPLPCLLLLAPRGRFIKQTNKQKKPQWLKQRIQISLITHVLQTCCTKKNVILAQRFWECEQHRSQFVAVTLNMRGSTSVGPQTEWVNKACIFKWIQSGWAQLSSPAGRCSGRSRARALLRPAPPGGRPSSRRARCLPGAAAMSRAGPGRAGTAPSCSAPPGGTGAVLPVFSLCSQCLVPPHPLSGAAGAAVPLAELATLPARVVVLGQHFLPWLCVPFLFYPQVRYHLCWNLAYSLSVEKMLEVVGVAINHSYLEGE